MVRLGVRVKCFGYRLKGWVSEDIALVLGLGFAVKVTVYVRD